MCTHRKTLLILVVGALSLCGLFAVAPPAQAGKYMLVWASDKRNDDNVVNSDFLAVIDANPFSRTYGKVVNTAEPPCVPGAHMLDELGLYPGTSSCVFNESHHLSEVMRDWRTGRRYVFAAGILSGNIYRFDVTNPLNIPPAQMVLTSRDVHSFSAPDVITTLPNGHLLATFMGSKDLESGIVGTPGGVVEFSPQGASTFIAEYTAAVAGGPERYMPTINGDTDTGLLAHPHGLDMRSDLNLMITADFSDPLQFQNGGTTVRLWRMSNLAAGPYKVIQLPNGPRVEETVTMNAPEGIMEVKLLRRFGRKGAIAFSMCGSVLYYTRDITVPDPQFSYVYDFGPCVGPGVFALTNDERFLVVPMNGLLMPNAVEYERDYPGEHTRRVAVLDLRPLLRNTSGPIQCGPPPVINNPITGFTEKMLAHNNGAPDCPVEVPNTINVDSQINFDTNGGPHLVEMDLSQTRFAFVDYFLDFELNPLPPTGIGGDMKIYMANFNPLTGQTSIDTRFKDEVTGEIGVNFLRPSTYVWPGARGQAGGAKPHGVRFIYTLQDLTPTTDTQLTISVSQ